MYISRPDVPILLLRKSSISHSFLLLLFLLHPNYKDIYYCLRCNLCHHHSFLTHILPRSLTHSLRCKSNTRFSVTVFLFPYIISAFTISPLSQAMVSTANSIFELTSLNLPLSYGEFFKESKTCSICHPTQNRENRV